jgi:hypothetical protein
MEGIPQGGADNPSIIQTDQGAIDIGQLSPGDRQQLLSALQNNPAAPSGAPGMPPGGGQPQDIQAAIDMARQLSAPSR